MTTSNATCSQTPSLIDEEIKKDQENIKVNKVQMEE